MKNLIITATDSKYADFLIDHWLVSLKENVNLKNTDILILDYGLTDLQVKKLKKEKVILKKCRRDGHVVTIRFRDIFNFLCTHNYGQIMSIDSGDIIFQKDINRLFYENTGTFRAFCEKKALLNFNNVFMSGSFSAKDIEKMKPVLKNRYPINGGVLLGPAGKFKSLSKEVYRLVKNKNVYGPDQVAMNYILYSEGFKELDEKYNAVLLYGDKDFYVKKGSFYFDNGEKIPIVHNAGGYSYFRAVDNFGYGPKYNHKKKLLNFIMRILVKLKRMIIKYT